MGLLCIPFGSNRLTPTPSYMSVTIVETPFYDHRRLDGELSLKLQGLGVNYQVRCAQCSLCAHRSRQRHRLSSGSVPPDAWTIGRTGDRG